jgi:hypothetical protein
MIAIKIHHDYLCSHNMKLSGEALASPLFNAPSASSAVLDRIIELKITFKR